ncbi:hypothetical protein PspLS_02040 [Pyricularia sp. CBS 133598]|nr:hypothetical protein PspLS_02040 [Pyricularia sp. CBS 133598]
MAAIQSPNGLPSMDSFVVGIIGMGDMGKMYARRLSAAGWRILACDQEEKFEALREEFSGHNNITIHRNGHLVSRASDYVIYSVEAASIGRVVAQYGPSTKQNAIVGGQTSCKDPEIKAFEQHLPSDVDIVSCHSLHGPNVDPKGQPLVLIPHRTNNHSSLATVEAVLKCFNSKKVILTAREHDRITADTQAVTHAAFLSMGKAWHASQEFPWEGARYVGGIENAKINLMLRIYAQKWHVYAGLAILNPEARKQIDQYARSTTELYKLMLEGRADELRRRVLAARDRVFGPEGAPKWEERPLLRDGLLDRFSLGGGERQQTLPNNHLSLLAMVDCWSALGIVPFDHMICSTPLFRLWLGVTESLFRSPARLDEALRIAVEDNTFRSDDLEFTFAARGWAECVSLGHFDTWRERFVVTQRFFEPRFADAIKVGNEMVKAVLESSQDSPAWRACGGCGRATTARLGRKFSHHAAAARSSTAAAAGAGGGAASTGRQQSSTTKLAEKPARTRFAPSPTGFLHLGSLRTALFNYLLAKATGGQFLLRLEDTDRRRIVPDAEERLYQDLRWAGLLWDEGPDVGGPSGPYRQSERLGHYSKYARQLLDGGRAYRCFCTREELAASQLGSQADSGSGGRYPGTCLAVSADESEERAARGDAHVIRFRSNTKPFTVPDLVYRRFRKKHMEDDFIIMKSDGFPTYHFANVVDDHLMDVTHVIRGAEWLISTPMHCDLYDALGWKEPIFAHVGLLVNKDRQKLSKRNSDIQISSYQEQNILPEALVDFVAHLGWRAPSKKGALTLPDLVNHFDLKFTKGDIVTDLDKIQYHQVQHLVRQLETENPAAEQDSIGPIVDTVSSMISGAAHPADVLHAALKGQPDSSERREYIRAALRLLSNKAWPLEKVVEGNMHLFWRPTSQQLADSLAQLRTSLGFIAINNTDGDVHGALTVIQDALKGISEENWEAETLKDSMTLIHSAISCRDAQGNDIPHAHYKPWRWFLLGSNPGPAVHSILELFGREETLGRLEEAMNVLKRSQEGSINDATAAQA